MANKYTSKKWTPKSDEVRAVMKYARCMDSIVPVLEPQQVAEAFKRMTIEPSPATIFEGQEVPKEITNLWLQARLSRERYFAALANHVLIVTPPIKREREAA